jgi:hypothetical protein
VNLLRAIVDLGQVEVMLPDICMAISRFRPPGLEARQPPVCSVWSMMGSAVWDLVRRRGGLQDASRAARG